MKRHKLAPRLRQAVELAAELEQEVQGGAGNREKLAETLRALRTLLDDLEVAGAQTEAQAEGLSGVRRRLAWEHQRYTELFDSAPDGYIVTDLWGNILEANHAAAALLGVEQRFLRGKPLRLYFHSDSLSTLYSRLNALQKKGAVERWEAALVTRFGKPLDVHLTVVTGMFTVYSKSTELRWLVQDISARKRAEREERDQLFRISFERADVGIGHAGPRGEWLRVNRRLCEITGCPDTEMLTSRLGTLFHAEDAEQVVDVQRRLLIGESPAPLEVRCVRADQKVIWVKVTASAVRSASGEFLYSIIVLDDVTERRRIEQAEREQRIIAEALRDTALVLASARDFADVIDQIVLGLGRVVRYDTAGLILIEGEYAHVARTQSAAESSPARSMSPAQGRRIRIDEVAFLREMCDRRQPVLRAEWSGHEVFQSIDGIEKTGSFVAAPIVAHDRAIGFLYLFSKTRYFFGGAHAELLRVFASQAAIAIQNTQMHHNARALAVMQERSRLARELHDAVTQNLFMAHMISDALATTWTDAPESKQQQLRQLQTVTRTALTEMRSLLLELRPEHLSNLDLGNQLRQLVEAFKVRKQVDVSLSIDGPEPPALDVRVAFYRIAQEALNNVVKHSQATRVEVTLEATADSAHLNIRDNGVGFDRHAITPGMGLQSMTERAAEILAALHIDSAPDAGTQVDVVWRAAANGQE
ncbi:MAG: PAS domain S-box protein [Anaerolineae bacterium]|nr:PAS domain S-box protein [Anaerolineae bacterium]